MQMNLTGIRRWSLAVAALAAVGTLRADTLTLKSDLTGDINWTAQTSYAGATRAPAANDTVVIPAGMTATLKDSDAASWSLVSSLARVTPEDGAEFVVDVATGESTLGCQVSWYPMDRTLERGRLVKTGAGTLYLNRTPSLVNDTVYYDYGVNFEVRAGSVKLPDNVNKTFYVGDVNLDANTFFYLPNWGTGTKDLGMLRCRDISGSGTFIITNTNRQKFGYDGYNGQTGTFAGAFSGNIWGTFSGNVNLTGKFENTAARTTRVDSNARVGFASMGLFGWGDVGGMGTFCYIGKEPLNFNRGLYLRYPTVFDSGVLGTGAVTLSAELNPDYSGILNFVFSGDSENEAVFNGGVSENTAALQWTKRGSGTWRMKNGGSKGNFHGSVSVEDGTLRFETIAEKGVQSSLGDATRLYSNSVYTTLDVESYRVPWAFLLGGADTEGILEYVGTASATCTTRPFAIRSVGGVSAESSGETTLTLAGFSAAGDGVKTLVLEGSNEKNNVARDITDNDYSIDQKGVLGVEKRGAGKWRLQGEQSFSGPLVVKEGSLEVDNYPEGTPFRYYRFYIKENAFSACTNNTAGGYYANMMNDDCIRWKNEEKNPSYWGTNELCAVCFKRLHFYDSNGALVVSNLTRTTAGSNPASGAALGEAQFAFVGENLPDQLPSGDQNIQNLFLESYSNDRGVVRFSKYLKLDDPKTWGCIELRVPDNTPTICGYDLLQYRAPYRSPFLELSGRAPVSWEVHGSADGVTYEKLHEVNSFKFWGGSDGNTASYWTYDQTNASWYAWSHVPDKFYHFAHTATSTSGATVNPLAQVASVSVLPGATLKVRGAPLALSKFKLDKAGTGRLQNVAFASTGTLFVTVEKGEDDLFFPVDFEGTKDSGNIANWSVNVNGVTRRGWSATVVAGGIRCMRPGCVLIVW